MRTNAQKLEGWQASAKARQAKRRAAMAAAGRPDTTRVDTAIIEAVAYLIAHEAVSALAADADADAKALRGTLRISVDDLKETTLQILVDRHGFDPLQSKRAFGRRIALRTAHLDRDHIPHLRIKMPASEAQAAA